MTRFTAADRLTRLLAVIPHVAGRGYVPLDEIAQRFGYPRAGLVDDLTEVLPFVGVAPFTPDTLIEVSVDEHRVRIDYADWFSRPLRLAPGEALALLAAGRTLAAAEPGDDAGPLVRGLTKLSAALGGDDGALEVHLGAVAEETLALLRTAVNEHRKVRLDYYSYGRDQRAARVVEPRRFYADDGHWYIAGHCHRAGADRVFRVDRIRHATLLDETFTVTDEADGGALGTFSPTRDHPRVVLQLAPEARWVVDQYPHDDVEEVDGGGVRLTLAVTAQAWLERLLVRLGPDVVVIEAPTGLGDDARSAAARRILGRYNSASGSTPSSTMSS